MRAARARRIATPAPADALPGRIDPASIEALPAAPGVYVFRGEGTLPLYIGKSINIRNRVLTHLRTPAAAKMVRQARRVEFCRTAGELGALLLEARWIKQQRPLFNVRLRQSRTLYAWQLPAAVPIGSDGASTVAPRLVDASRIDFAHAQDLYGPYFTKQAAADTLRTLADEQGLCLQRLGLEQRTRRGCFRAQLGRCHGVCTGAEPVVAHDTRLLAALAEQRVHRWPHAGAVGIIERGSDLEQVHWVRNWCYLGSYALDAAAAPDHGASFDLDSYRILVRPLLARTLELREA